MSEEHEPTWPKERPAEARIIPGLFRSRNYIWDNDHRIVEGHGVSWSQFLTLSSLRSVSPDHVMSPTQLYNAAQVTSGGMTKMLHGLTNAGLITRIDNPDDKRSRLVQLTPAGAALAEAIVAELIDTNKALIGGILTPNEAETLADLLAKLSAGLHKRNKPGA
ncbi:MarR family winged helix-turn-helix transcriptional regulator [Roseobacteraceae bacterium S113]